MFTYEAEALARAVFRDRVREAHDRRLAREVRGGARPSPARAPEPGPERHSRLWRLVHLPHAYG